MEEEKLRQQKHKGIPVAGQKKINILHAAWNPEQIQKIVLVLMTARKRAARVRRFVFLNRIIRVLDEDWIIYIDFFAPHNYFKKRMRD